MDKRIYIFIAVLAFFAGAIWVSEVPVVATLVAFLEVCAGFVCGYFFTKKLANETIARLTEEIKKLNGITVNTGMLHVEPINTTLEREAKLKKAKEETATTKASKPRVRKTKKSE